MTYLELCEAVRADADVQGTITTTVGQLGILGNIVRWVQEAYYDIQTEHDNWEFDLTEATATLNASADSILLDLFEELKRIVPGSLWVQETNGPRYLRQLDWINFNHRWPKNSTSIKTGKPNIYAEVPQKNEEIRFSTEADQNYTMNFQAYKVIDEFTGNGSTPRFPQQYHDMIKNAALVKYAQFYNAKNILKPAEAAYKKKLKRMEFDFLPKNFYHTVPFV